MLFFVRRYQYIPTPPPAASTVSITSVNGGVLPLNAQASVVITGNNFGVNQGSVTYNGAGLLVNAWGDTQIDVAWPDVPFDAAYINLPIVLSTPLAENIRTLEVTNSTFTSSDSTSVATQKGATAGYAIITNIPSYSIYANDSGIELGADRGYIRINSGAVDFIYAESGVLQGITSGTQIEYAIWDESAQQWNN